MSAENKEGNICPPVNQLSDDEHKLETELKKLDQLSISDDKKCEEQEKSNSQNFTLNKQQYIQKFVKPTKNTRLSNKFNRKCLYSCYNSSNNIFPFNETNSYQSNNIRKQGRKNEKSLNRVNSKKWFSLDDPASSCLCPKKEIYKNRFDSNTLSKNFISGPIIALDNYCQSGSHESSQSEQEENLATCKNRNLTNYNELHNKLSNQYSKNKASKEYCETFDAKYRKKHYRNSDVDSCNSYSTTTMKKIHYPVYSDIFQTNTSINEEYTGMKNPNLDEKYYSSARNRNYLENRSKSEQQMISNMQSVPNGKMNKTQKYINQFDARTLTHNNNLEHFDYEYGVSEQQKTIKSEQLKIIILRKLQRLRKMKVEKPEMLPFVNIYIDIDEQLEHYINLNNESKNSLDLSKFIHIRHVLQLILDICKDDQFSVNIENLQPMNVIKLSNSSYSNDQSDHLKSKKNINHYFPLKNADCIKYHIIQEIGQAIDQIFDYLLEKIDNLDEILIKLKNIKDQSKQSNNPVGLDGYPLTKNFERAEASNDTVGNTSQKISNNSSFRFPVDINNISDCSKNSENLGVLLSQPSCNIFDRIGICESQYDHSSKNDNNQTNKNSHTFEKKDIVYNLDYHNKINSSSFHLDDKKFEQFDAKNMVPSTSNEDAIFWNNFSMYEDKEDIHCNYNFPNYRYVEGEYALESTYTRQRNEVNKKYISNDHSKNYEGNSPCLHAQIVRDDVKDLEIQREDSIRLCEWPRNLVNPEIKDCAFDSNQPRFNEDTKIRTLFVHHFPLYVNKSLLDAIFEQYPGFIRTTIQFIFSRINRRVAFITYDCAVNARNALYQLSLKGIQSTNGFLINSRAVLDDDHHQELYYKAKNNSKNGRMDMTIRQDTDYSSRQSMSFGHSFEQNKQFKYLQHPTFHDSQFKFRVELARSNTRSIYQEKQIGSIKSNPYNNFHGLYLEGRLINPLDQIQKETIKIIIIKCVYCGFTNLYSADLITGRYSRIFPPPIELIDDIFTQYPGNHYQESVNESTNGNSIKIIFNIDNGAKINMNTILGRDLKRNRNYESESGLNCGHNRIQSFAESRNWYEDEHADDESSERNYHCGDVYFIRDNLNNIKEKRLHVDKFNHFHYEKCVISLDDPQSHS